MSISFSRKKNIDFSNVFNDGFQLSRKNIGGVLGFEKERFIKMFDKFFFDFISFRKQRDLLIVNSFLISLISDIEVDDKFKKNHRLSDVFSFDNNKILVNNNLTPISTNELNTGLNLSISTLKKFFDFAESVKYFDDLDLKKNISAKIKKVKTLDDWNILKTLTSDKKVLVGIQEKLGDVLKYKDA